MNKPNYDLVCCGKVSKWVEISVNIAYFYCEQCKEEVTAGKHKPTPLKSKGKEESDDPFSELTLPSWGHTNYAPTPVGNMSSPPPPPPGAQPPPSNNITSPPPLPYPYKSFYTRLDVGDRVKINSPNLADANINGQLATVLCADYTADDYEVRTDNTPFMIRFFPRASLMKVSTAATYTLAPKQPLLPVQNPLIVGDRVLITMRGSAFQGKFGTVTMVDFTCLHPYVVETDLGDLLYFDPDDLVKF